MSILIFSKLKERLSVMHKICVKNCHWLFRPILLRKNRVDHWPDLAGFMVEYGPAGLTKGVLARLLSLLG